nr:MAG TPA: hypothetical protein [Myoviridae sp. ctO7l1]
MYTRLKEKWDSQEGMVGVHTMDLHRVNLFTDKRADSRAEM